MGSRQGRPGGWVLVARAPTPSSDRPTRQGRSGGSDLRLCSRQFSQGTAYSRSAARTALLSAPAGSPPGRFFLHCGVVHPAGPARGEARPGSAACGAGASLEDRDPQEAGRQVARWTIAEALGWRRRWVGAEALDGRHSPTARSVEPPLWPL